MKIKTIKETVKTEHADGTIEKTEKESTTKIEASTEPDYIKLYTNMWCEFNGIPITWRNLFLELASRMSYACKSDLNNSQIVATGGPIKQAICDKLQIKHRQYQNGLAALCECNAVKKIARGFYQINPDYAGKGQWKYNPQTDQGGIEDLIATFHFKDKKIETEIIWADDGKDNELNKIYRQGLKTTPKDHTVLSTTTITDP